MNVKCQCQKRKKIPLNDLNRSFLYMKLIYVSLLMPIVISEKKNFDKIKIKITIRIKNTMASVNLHWFISCMGKINLAIFAHTYMISGASKAINFF